MTMWKRTTKGDFPPKGRILGIASPKTEIYNTIAEADENGEVDIYYYGGGNNEFSWMTCNSNYLNKKWHVDYWMEIPLDEPAYP